MGFNMLQCRETLYQVVKVVTTMIFDTKVIDDEDKSNSAGRVTKETRRVGLDNPPPGEETYQALRWTASRTP